MTFIFIFLEITTLSTVYIKTRLHWNMYVSVSHIWILDSEWLDSPYRSKGCNVNNTQ